MTANEEKPKSRLSKIVTVIKWCSRWGATAGGVYFIIYFVIHMPRRIQFVQIIAIIFCILCCFILIIYSHTKRIRIIRIIPRVFIPIFIIGMSLVIFVYITITYYPTIGSRIASGLTKEKILSLNLGMDKKM